MKNIYKSFGNIIKSKKNKCLILLIIIFLLILLKKFYHVLYISNHDLSIVVYFQNLTEPKHLFFSEIMKKINSKRNFYFIKTEEKFLDPKINSIIKNNPIKVKIVQSNFPDTFYLPLILSLYGTTVPDFILFLEGDYFVEKTRVNLLKWINNAFKKLIKDNYDYIFGNSQIHNGKKIGRSILLSKSSIIQHLLYYTDSNTNHANPFIQLSLATNTKFCFISFKFIKQINPIDTKFRFSSNIECPQINDKANPSLCIILPNFKRNYLSFSFSAFSNQTYKPKFYLVIQNDNRIYYNISEIRNKVDEPIYHIWMQNWNSFFFLNHRFASVIPCDFALKYDDDQWPRDNKLHEKLLNMAKNKNIIIGNGGFFISKTFCGYYPKNYTTLEKDIMDHASVPILIRPHYIKLDARNYIYRTYGGEDIALSLNSYKLCNVTSKRFRMELIERQSDGNNQRADKQIISQYENEKTPNFKLFTNSYCYLIQSGYVPRRWVDFHIPLKDFLNITIEHKKLY